MQHEAPELMLLAYHKALGVVRENFETHVLRVEFGVGLGVGRLHAPGKYSGDDGCVGANADANPHGHSAPVPAAD